MQQSNESQKCHMDLHDKHGILAHIMSHFKANDVQNTVSNFTKIHGEYLEIQMHKNCETVLQKQ